MIRWHRQTAGVMIIRLELTRLRGHLILEATPEKGAHVGSSVEISG